MDLTMAIQLFIVFICLLINGYTDLKKRQTYTMVFIIAYTILLLHNRDLILIVLILLTLLFNRDHNFVGGGDLDAACMVMYALGLSNGLYSYMIACICSVVYSVTTKNREIPFVTMLLIGYVFTVLKLIL